MSKQVNQLQDPVAQQWEDPIRISSSSALKGMDSCHTEKLEDVLQSPLVEKNATAFASYVQLAPNAEDCEHGESAVRRLSASAEELTAELRYLAAEVTAKIEANEDSYGEDFWDFENDASLSDMNILDELMK
jgi:hypothetical protein